MPVERVDPDAFLFMGANPCWTPELEFKQADHPDAALGDCILCGGRDGFAVDGEVLMPAQIEDGSRRVCARCARSGRAYGEIKRPGKDRAESDSGVPVACPDDPGYVERDGVKVPERFARMMKG